MAPTLGFTFLLLVFCVSAFSAFCSFFFSNPLVGRSRDHLEFRMKMVSTTPDQRLFGVVLAFLILLAAFAAQLCLIYSFITSDYSVRNVYQNSHHLKPLIYKISGSWGNHEGSMLLLVSVLAAYNFFFALLSKLDEPRKSLILGTQSSIIALFAAFAAIVSNPFARIFPVPTIGVGLNPILQDIGLALHPPMLYTGYLGFSLVFSFAIAGLLSEKVDRDFARYLKPWLFFSYGFLTLGIGLGAWWAYRELGWGGYWFWDPVENVSLMPWLAATALIHCLKLLERKEAFKIWTIFLAILTFILCLIGLFLVRSGILTSVHSFAVDAKRGFFVIGLIVAIGGSALALFGIKLVKLLPENAVQFGAQKNQAGTRRSREWLILLNNYFLLIALFTVLLGTLYPIFSQSFFDQFISIGPDYYNKIIGILLVPFLVFLGISGDVSDGKKSIKEILLTGRNSLVLLVSILITSLTFFYHKSGNFFQIVILFLAIFALLKTVISEFIRKNLVMFCAHCGFCLLLCGVVLSSSFGEVKEVNLKKGESLFIANYELKFEEISYFAGKNFIARQGNFGIYSVANKSNQRKLGTLHPQLRYYPSPEQTTNETSIRHSFFGDLYLVIGNKDEQENYAIRAYHKPFIWLIWLGCVMIFLGVIPKILRTFLKK